MNPRALLAKVSNLQEATSLYRKLGTFLSSASPESKVKTTRQEAIEVRRALEQQFGAGVRSTSVGVVTFKAPPEELKKAAAGFRRPPKEAIAKKSYPPSVQRNFYCVPKPSRGEYGTSHLAYVSLDPDTLEPIGVFHDRKTISGETDFIGLIEAIQRYHQEQYERARYAKTAFQQRLSKKKEGERRAKAILEDVNGLILALQRYADAVKRSIG